MKRAILWFRRVALFIGITMIAGTVTPLCPWYVQWLSGPWTAQNGGTLLVPAAEMEDPETMGLATYRRAYYAHLYWQRGGYSRILLMGRDAAPTMAKWLIYEGVPKEAIVVESGSDSTRGNAEEAKRILADWKARTGLEQPAQPLVLLTSDYHCWRARRVFAAAGLNVIVQPVPDAAKRWPYWPARWGICTEAGIETAKIVWYFVRGWL